MANAIIRQNTRILTPREYRLLRENLNAKYQVICDVLLNTGMRVEEFWDLVDHPQWYDPVRHCIDLPKGAVKKVKAVYQERTIFLTPDGCDAVKVLFSLKDSIRRTSRVNMGFALKRGAAAAHIDPQGIVPKMFRKTLVSWLIACFPDRSFQVSASIGHELETMRRHYANLGFQQRDVEEMQKFLQGWGKT